MFKRLVAPRVNSFSRWQQSKRRSTNCADKALLHAKPGGQNMGALIVARENL
jgi:hypothetical protein